MFHLGYINEIVILISSYRKVQGLLEAVIRHAAAVGMRTNASKVMSALIPSEPRQTAMFDGEFKYLGAMFVANGQGPTEIRSSISLAHSAFPRLEILCLVTA